MYAESTGARRFMLQNLAFGGRDCTRYTVKAQLFGSSGLTENCTTASKSSGCEDAGVALKSASTRRLRVCVELANELGPLSLGCASSTTLSVCADVMTYLSADARPWLSPSAEIALEL